MRVQEVALVIIIFLVGIIMFKSCGKREVEKKLARYQDMLENQQDSTRHYRDVYGNRKYSIIGAEHPLWDEIPDR